jgi:diamine N-acetyltransferase
MHYNIRPADISDIPAILHIACITWPLAYAPVLKAGQVGYMLANMYKPEVLKAQMEQQGHRFYLLEHEGIALGFAAIGSEADSIFKLHKIYVAPKTQGTGAGGLLLDYAVNCTRLLGGKYLKLQVNRQNPALHFYLKKGFDITEEADLDIGQGFFMNDYIMTKKL